MECAIDNLTCMPIWALIALLAAVACVGCFLMVWILPDDMCGPGGWLIDTNEPLLGFNWGNGEDGPFGDGDGGGDGGD